jgi:hypothetical protein
MMPLRLGVLRGLDAFVHGIAFGMAAAGQGGIAVACTATPGVLFTDFRDDRQQQLRLVLLSSDGRQTEVLDGAFGRGVWFGAAGADAWFAIGERDARSPAFVQHWSMSAGSGGSWRADVSRAVSAAVRRGQFAAGVDARGTLYVVAAGPRGLAVTSFSRDGQQDSFPLVSPGSSPAVPGRVTLVPGAQQLVFDQGRMLVLANIREVERRGDADVGAVVIGFRVADSTSQIDPDWGDNGVWTAPDDFVPFQCRTHPDGTLLCLGWLSTVDGSAFTVIRIANGGGDDDRPGWIQGGLIPAPLPLSPSVDSNGGLLVALTAPNPISVAFGVVGLPSVAQIHRYGPDGAPDVTFGNQGFGWAWYPNYPLTVQALVSSDTGFFVLCNRPASITGTNGLPVVFAYRADGQPVGTFGETGIVHHDGIPTDRQIHEPLDAFSAGVNRVSHASSADEFELAVTRLGSIGTILWRNGTTHGLHSAPLVVPQQGVPERVDYFQIQVFATWGSLLVIGGNAVAPSPGGFVTFRDRDGTPYPSGQGTSLGGLGDYVYALTPLTNGMLEVAYRRGTTAEKILVRPDLTRDPSPPVVIPPSTQTGLGLELADGSRVVLCVHQDYGYYNLWLIRRLPNGSVDPAFGGANATTPVDPTHQVISRSTVAGLSLGSGGSFGQSKLGLEWPGGLMSHPSGGYLLLMHVKWQFLDEYTPQGVALLATRWTSSGLPDTRWAPDGAVELGDVYQVKQVVLDNPDGLVLVGATRATVAPTVAPTLWRIRVTDGRLDPNFGRGGILSVHLRGDQPRVALGLHRRADGTTVVPVAGTNPPSASFNAVEPPNKALMWLEIA